MTDQGVRASHDAPGAPRPAAQEQDARPLFSDSTEALGAQLRAHAPAGATSLAAGHVSLFEVSLPVRGRRARQAALAFAVEDKIAQPVDRAHVALCRDGSKPGTVLAAVVDRDVMARHLDAAEDGPVLPETFALPTPSVNNWTVYHDGERAVVRTPDGGGFATASASVSVLWQLAGRPALTVSGTPLPAALPASQTTALPTPDPADMAVDLRQGNFAPASSDWRPVITRAAALIGVGALGHLALAGADTWALGRIAEKERTAAEIALADVQPGMRLPDDPAPVLAQLTARPAETLRQGAFLPLLSGVSEVLLTEGTAFSWRRLSFAADNAQIAVLMEAPNLKALQDAEAALRGAGFTVDSGAATARDGGAEAEFRISGGGS
ncbi:MAG: type II secretion system protein GspL [Pseudomonadota bacterium]